MTRCWPSVTGKRQVIRNDLCLQHPGAELEGGVAIADRVSVEQVIARRKARVITRTGYLWLLARLCFLALIVYLLFTFCFLITQSHGQGMFPAVKDGDLCVVFRTQAQRMLGEKVKADDVVAYQTDGKRAFGRVVAVAGDVVMLGDSGSLMVNGVTEGGDIVFSTYAEGELEYPYRVPDGCVYVLGDRRVSTTDSRILGPIPLESVEGKLITILRRREI